MVMEVPGKRRWLWRCRGREECDGGAGEEKMVMEVPGKRRW